MYIFFLLIIIPSIHSLDHNPCAGQPQNCVDEKTGCDIIFSNPSVDCLIDEIQDYVEGCRKQCNRCCEDPKFGSCKDLSPDGCSFAACIQVPDYSFDNCKSTCGLCQATEPLCTDKNDQCPKYASLCTSDPEVGSNCPVTCKVGCAAPIKTTVKTTTTTKKVVTTTKKLCYDADEACPSWVKNGFCSNPDPALKEKYCAKSCGYCIK